MPLIRWSALIAGAALLLLSAWGMRALREPNSLEQALSLGGLSGGWSFLIKNNVPGISPQAYRMGEEVFKQYGIEGLRECSPRFAAGCYAGVIQSVLTAEGSAAIPELNRACDALGPRTCIHGFGHGFPHITKSDLPAALKLCDTYVEPIDRPTCWGGAVQEYSAMNEFRAEETEGLSLCGSLDEAYQAVCAWVFTDKVWSKREGLTLPEMAARCPQLSGPLRQGCALGVGSLLIRDRAEEPGHLQNTCDSFFSPPDAYYCTISLVNSAPAFRAGAQARSLCESLPESFRALCVHMAENQAIFDHVE